MAGTASDSLARFASLRYDAIDETEAHVVGGDIAACAGGFDPRTAVALWDRLTDATHRDKASRSVQISAWASKQGVVSRKLLRALHFVLFF
jgi:hypothetical protein